MGGVTQKRIDKGVSYTEKRRNTTKVARKIENGQKASQAVFKVGDLRPHSVLLRAGIHLVPV